MIAAAPWRERHVDDAACKLHEHVVPLLAVFPAPVFDDDAETTVKSWREIGEVIAVLAMFSRRLPSSQLRRVDLDALKCTL
jgi:hypothetical protein